MRLIGGKHADLEAASASLQREKEAAGSLLSDVLEVRLCGLA